VAVAGAVLAEWWKYGLTGTHLTPGEVFRDMLVSGLLAASAEHAGDPARAVQWHELLRLSQTGAAVVALAYIAANAHRLPRRAGTWAPPPAR
jgi:hypothetical protein